MNLLPRQFVPFLASVALLPLLSVQESTAAAKLSTSADAILLAHADATKPAGPGEGGILHLVRYLWLQDANPLDAKAASLTLNLVSRNSEIKLPASLADGFLLRVDAAHYAPLEADRRTWLQAWEQLRFDPHFNQLVTKDQVRLVDAGAADAVPGKPLLVWSWRNGSWVKVRVDQLAEGEVARLPAPHLPQVQLAELKAVLKTEAPVVSLPYFLTRALTSIKDQFGNAVIFGGLYYEFTGTDAKPARGTAEEALLRSLGVGDGGKLEGFFDRIPSERRAAMWKRGPTGKPGQVAFLPTQAVLSGGWLAATSDPADGSYDGRTNAMQSLLGFRAAAREIIYTRFNRLHGFALFNGQGALQQEAPANVALAPVWIDRSGKTNPHSGRLQNAVSCINCHWARDDSAGFIAVQNDVLTLRKRRGLVVIDDASIKGKDSREIESQLEQLYQFDPDRGEKLQSRARDDLSEAVLRATGPWPGGKGDQTDVVRLAGSHLLGVFNRWNYDPVSARDALRELGVEPPPKPAAGKPDEAAALWDKVVPPSKVEDATIGSLAAGLEVPRFNWSIAYSFAAARLKKPAQEEKKEGKQP